MVSIFISVSTVLFYYKSILVALKPNYDVRLFWGCSILSSSNRTHITIHLPWEVSVRRREGPHSRRNPVKAREVEMHVSFERTHTPQLSCFVDFFLKNLLSMLQWRKRSTEGHLNAERRQARELPKVRGPSETKSGLKRWGFVGAL